MKELFILYNPIMKEYYLSRASNPYQDRHRKVVLESNVLEETKLLVDYKRKSILNLLNVEENIARKIESAFKNSKIEVQRKSK